MRDPRELEIVATALLRYAREMMTEYQKLPPGDVRSQMVDDTESALEMAEYLTELRQMNAAQYGETTDPAPNDHPKKPRKPARQDAKRVLRVVESELQAQNGHTQKEDNNHE